MLQDSLETKDSKPFWRYIKSQRQDNTGVAPLKRGGLLHPDSATKAHILNEQFSSVFTEDKENDDTVLEGPSIPPIEELVISVNGVTKLLKEINPSKAGGPDNLPCRLLREPTVELAPILTYIYIYVYIYTNSHYPQASYHQYGNQPMYHPFLRKDQYALQRTTDLSA